MTDPMPTVRNILGMPAPEIDYLAEAKKHAADAEFLVSDSPYMAGTVAEGQLLAAIAQAEATEALVEQQRVANLIAVAFAENNLFVELADTNPYKPLFDELRAGLGLA